MRARAAPYPLAPRQQLLRRLDRKAPHRRRGNTPGGNGEGMRANRQGGGFGGQRPGGGAGGPGGGFNPQSMTPEQREQMMARFRERGGPGGAGGFGGFGGGGGGMGLAGGGVTRQPQQRRGTVMVKLADGTLEPRQVVVGVTDRVHGQVIEGLKEGEGVVVGKIETEPQTGPTAAGANNNNNNNNSRSETRASRVAATSGRSDARDTDP